MDVANAQGDQWVLEIDGNVVGWVTATMSGSYIPHEVTNPATGKDVLAILVEGRRPDLKIEIQEPTLQNLKIALGSATGVPLEVGTTMPGVTVNFHNPNDEDTTLDRHFFNVAFTNIEQTKDGQGQNTFTVTGVCMRTAEGFVWQYGKPEEEAPE